MSDPWKHFDKAFEEMGDWIREHANVTTVQPGKPSDLPHRVEMLERAVQDMRQTIDLLVKSK